MQYSYGFNRDLGQIIEKRAKKIEEKFRVYDRWLGNRINISTVVFVIFSVVFLVACSPAENDPKDEGQIVTPPTNSQPIAVIASTPSDNATGTININEGDSITYNGTSSSDLDSNLPLTFDWKFTGGSIASSALESGVTVQYMTMGTYQVVLTVTDSLQLSSTVSSVTVVVLPANTNLPPSSVLNTTPAADSSGNINILEGQSVSFSGAGSVDPDNNNPLTYDWSFAGGSLTSSNLVTPGLVQYNMAGNFLTTLTVIDNLGLSSSVTSVTVVVTAPANQAPSPIITTTPAVDSSGNINITEGQSISFSGAGSVDPDNNNPLTYDWAFAGGSLTSSNLVSPGLVQYNTAGNFLATLTVKDNLGLSSSVTSVAVVVTAPANQAPSSIITTTPAADSLGNVNIIVGQSVSFSGTSSVDPDNNNPLTYDWTFASGSLSSSNLVTPGSVQYNTVGSFQATLFVTDNFGLSSQISIINIVVSQLPVGKTKTISLVVMNDLHAHLTAHDDLTRLPDGTSGLVKRGGVARIATEIKRIRAENPATAFMNIGDTFHGGVEAFYSDGNDIEEAVNALGIDVGVPGNWDFAFGPLVTRARFKKDPTTSALNYQNIAANWFDANLITGQITGPILPETFKMNLGGVTVGFVGLTSDIVPDMSATLAVRMAFTKGEQGYLDLIGKYSTALRTGATPAQVVVVMSELGIHKDKQLADKIPSGLVDVFFSAHTHELTTTPLISTSGALVVEAGDDTYLGRMDVVLDQNNAILARNWQTIPLEMSIMPDKAVSDIVTKVRARYLVASPNITNPSVSSDQMLIESIDTVLTTTNRMIARDHVLENSFNNLMTDLIKAETGTDIAISRGFRFGAHVAALGMAYEDSTVIAAGDFTVEDAYRFIPVPYTLSTGVVTGTRLKQIIEQSLTAVFSPDAFLQIGGWVDGFSGLSMALDLSQPDGKRLQSLSLTKNGLLTPILNNDILTITGCVRPFDNDPSALCAYTGFTNVTSYMNNTTPYTGIDFLIDALQNKLSNASLRNTLDRTDISDRSGIQFWPISEFVQPINGVP